MSRPGPPHVARQSPRCRSKAAQDVRERPAATRHEKRDPDGAPALQHLELLAGSAKSLRLHVPGFDGIAPEPLCLGEVTFEALDLRLEIRDPLLVVQRRSSRPLARSWS